MLCRSKNDPELRKSREIDREMKYLAEQKAKYTELLLLGTGESGKTTIIKQMKILHINGYTESEKKEKIPIILENVHESIYTIIYNMDKIDPPIEIKNEEAKTSARFILKLGKDIPKEFTNEYYNHISLLWKDETVQECFNRSNEYQLIDCAEQFLNRIDDIRKPDYIPTLRDILFCRVTTTNISKIDFEMPVPRQYGGGTAKFSLHDVGGQRGHRSKWISVFEGINSILFLIAASDFDLTLREDNTQNRLVESFELFKDMFFNRFLQGAGMIMFLNKQDLLKRKIENGKRLGDYFPEYNSYVVPKKEGNNDDEYERSKLFMRQKLWDITKSEEIKNENFNKNRKIFIHFTVATDTNNVKLVFENIHQMIIEENLSKSGILGSL